MTKVECFYIGGHVRASRRFQFVCEELNEVSHVQYNRNQSRFVGGSKTIMPVNVPDRTYYEHFSPNHHRSSVRILRVGLIESGVWQPKLPKRSRKFASWVESVIQPLQHGLINEVPIQQGKIKREIETNAKVPLRERSVIHIEDEIGIEPIWRVQFYFVTKSGRWLYPERRSSRLQPSSRFSLCSLLHSHR